ncbi:MAG: pentapeptide repeat-containing protein [Desulfobulbus sp.]|nr:pentapeptide repeat-containing protein [Desulfobulbus sp.]
MRRALLPALLAYLALSGCAPTTVNSLVQEKGAQQLAGHEVMQLVKGNTLQLQAFNENAHLYFDPSGKIFAKTGLSTDKDKGKWDVSEGGDLCFRMEKWWYGDLRCYSVYAADTGKYRLATGNGVLRYKAQVEDGDSKSIYIAEDGGNKSLRRSLRKAEKQEASASRKTSQRPLLIEDSAPSQYLAKDTEATVAYMAKDCPGCNFAGADLGKADLIQAHLAGADLHGANLSMANLRRANLQKANLQKAAMAYANLPGADLRGADLRGANLKGANLIKADLTGAKLEGANLTEVLKEGAKGI